MRSTFIKNIGSNVNTMGGNMGILMDKVKTEMKDNKKKEDLQR